MFLSIMVESLNPPPYPSGLWFFTWKSEFSLHKGSSWLLLVGSIVLVGGGRVNGVHSNDYTRQDIKCLLKVSTLPYNNCIKQDIGDLSMKYTGYIRVSDINKADGTSQKRAIQAYAEKVGITITDWVEEHVSASKTDIADRKLSGLIASQHNIVVSDITRLGRNKVMALVGVIGQIANYGELHLAYDERVINSDNADDAETIFTVVGQSFASAVEAKKRSERAKAGHAKRKADGLHSGRKQGQVVKSRLDEHTAFIMNELDNGTAKTKILAKLADSKDCKVSRSRFYTWLESRGL